MSAAFADVSLLQLALVAAMALVASLVGGVAGYGTGALMPLVLVPLIDAVAFPGAFLARFMVEHLPVKVHTAMLDAVVVIGALAMIAQALRG